MSRPRRTALRSFCELAVGAVVLAVLLHTFAATGLIAPMYVSAGSMAPQLVGPHWKAACPTCGASYAVGTDAPPQAGRTSCPECGQTVFLEDAVRERGDKLYVDRVTPSFRSPQRWEPLVFRCPEDARSLCVKRVVGLPGETIQFDRGDLVVDGRVQRKSLAEQSALRLLVHRERASAKWWRAEDEDTAWQWSGNAWRLRCDEGRRGDGARDWLAFAPPGNGHVTDRFAYNAGVAAVDNRTGDLMLTFRLAAQPAGSCHNNKSVDDGLLWIDCAVGGGGQVGENRLVITVSPERREAWLGPSPKLPPDGSRVGLNRRADAPLDVTVSLFDRQLLVTLDGVHVIRHPLAGPAEANDRSFALAAAGLKIELRDLAVWRDVVYTDRPAGPARSMAESARWQLGSREYFVVGDNPAVSHDSRTWQHGPGLQAKRIVGKPIGLR